MDVTASKVEHRTIWPINSKNRWRYFKAKCPKCTYTITRQLPGRHVHTLPASMLSRPLLLHHRAACHCNSRISQRPTGCSGWALVPRFTAPPSLSNPVLLARALLGARQPTFAVAKSLLPRAAVSAPGSSGNIWALGSGKSESDRNEPLAGLPSQLREQLQGAGAGRNRCLLWV